MNWIEGLVCIVAILGLCFIVDCLSTTVRYWCGERQRRYYPMPPPERSPTVPPGME